MREEGHEPLDQGEEVVGEAQCMGKMRHKVGVLVVR